MYKVRVWFSLPHPQIYNGTRWVIYVPVPRTVLLNKLHLVWTETSLLFFLVKESGGKKSLNVLNCAGNYIVELTTDLFFKYDGTKGRYYIDLYVHKTSESKPDVIPISHGTMESYSTILSWSRTSYIIGSNTDSTFKSKVGYPGIAISEIGNDPLFSDIYNPLHSSGMKTWKNVTINLSGAGVSKPYIYVGTLARHYNQPVSDAAGYWGFYFLTTTSLSTLHVYIVGVHETGGGNTNDYYVKLIRLPPNTSKYGSNATTLWQLPSEYTTGVASYGFEGFLLSNPSGSNLKVQPHFVYFADQSIYTHSGWTDTVNALQLAQVGATGANHRCYLLFINWTCGDWLAVREVTNIQMRSWFAIPYTPVTDIQLLEPEFYLSTGPGSSMQLLNTWQTTILNNGQLTFSTNMFIVNDSLHGPQLVTVYKQQYSGNNTTTGHMVSPVHYNYKNSILSSLPNLSALYPDSSFYGKSLSTGLIIMLNKYYTTTQSGNTVIVYPNIGFTAHYMTSTLESKLIPIIFNDGKLVTNNTHRTNLTPQMVPTSYIPYVFVDPHFDRYYVPKYLTPLLLCVPDPTKQEVVLLQIQHVDHNDASSPYQMHLDILQHTDSSYHVNILTQNTHNDHSDTRMISTHSNQPYTDQEHSDIDRHSNYLNETEGQYSNAPHTDSYWADEILGIVDYSNVPHSDHNNTWHNDEHYNWLHEDLPWVNIPHSDWSDSYTDSRHTDYHINYPHIDHGDSLFVYTPQIALTHSDAHGDMPIDFKPYVADFMVGASSQNESLYKYPNLKYTWNGSTLTYSVDNSQVGRYVHGDWV